jgi:alpha-L-fucosidase 2
LIKQALRIHTENSPTAEAFHPLANAPAIPSAWRTTAFSTLRAQGAFLLSAEMKEGKMVSVRIVSEQGGLLRLANPFPDQDYRVQGIPIREIHVNSNIVEIQMKPGQEIELTNS